MALRLHMAAHHAKAQQRLCGARDETGNDGVKRAFARADAIWMGGIQCEAMAAILQRDAGIGHHDASAEAVKIRLDERHHHAARIGGTEINRVVGNRQRHRRQRHRLLADARGRACNAAGFQQLFWCDEHRARIGKVLRGGTEGKLHRFNLLMHGLCAVQWWHFATGQYGQRYLCGEALTIGRDLMQHHVAISLRDGRHPVGAMGGQIAGTQGATGGDGGPFDACREFALVKRCTVGGGYFAQGARGGRQMYARAGRRCRPEVTREFRIGIELGNVLLPLAGRDRADGVALFRVMNGAVEQGSEGQLAVTRRQFHPHADRARHRHRIPAKTRHGLVAGEALQSPASGGAP